jgi:RNA polymerase primary sigma factor
MKDLRVEFKAKNNVLWHVVFDLHRSVSEFCRVNGFSATTVGQWINLTRSPYSAYKGRGQLTSAAKRLVELVSIPADELFPPHLYSGAFPSAGVAEVDANRFISLNTHAEAKRLTAPDGIDAWDMKNAIAAALDTLSPREAQVLRMRFGLGDDPHEHTLEEVCQSFAVTRERIRAIQNKALSKMRQPDRLGKMGLRR